MQSHINQKNGKYRPQIHEHISMRSIVCLNLPSFSGGLNPWGTPNRKKSCNRKPDDNLQSLHNILFGKRAKKQAGEKHKRSSETQEENVDEDEASESEADSQLALNTEDPQYQDKRLVAKRNGKLTIQTFQVNVGKERENVLDMFPYMRYIRKVGIDIPKIEVRYTNLSIEGDVHVGSRALPILLNAALNTIEGLLQSIRLVPSKKRVMKIFA